MLKNYLSPLALQSLRREQAERLKARAIVSKWPDNPIHWIEQNFYLYDTGELFRFDVCQHNLMARALHRALLRNPDGSFRYRRVIWSWPKKSAKSSIIAAVIHLKAASRPNAQIALMGHDQRQASSRIGFYLKRAILLGQKYNIPSCVHVEVPKLDSGTIRYPNGSLVEMLAVDPRGEAGGNHDDLVYSELWAWKHEAHQLMWAEMTISPTKYGYAQQWIDTYAGFVGDSPILEPLYEYGVNGGTRIWDDLEVYEHGDQLTVWVTEPLMDWQTKAYYASEEATLTPEQFLRLHRNQWVSSSAAFIPYEWWEACRDTQLPPLRPYDETVVAIDASTHDDGFAVVMVSRDPRQSDQPNRLILRDYRVWYPADYAHFDYEEPKAYLRHLAQHHNVVQFAFDPYQMKEVADTLHKEGLGSFKPFNQGQERAVADKMLYDTLRTRGLTHHTRQDFNEHIQNANRRDDDRDMMRIVKRNQNQKIDLVVALSMACKRARDVLLVGE